MTSGKPRHLSAPSFFTVRRTDLCLPPIIHRVTYQLRCDVPAGHQLPGCWAGGQYPLPVRDPSPAFLWLRWAPLSLAFQGFCSSLFHFPSASSVSLLLDIFCQHLNINLSFTKYSLSSWRDPSLDSSRLPSHRALQPLPSGPDVPQEQPTFRISSSSFFFHSLSR